MLGCWLLWLAARKATSGVPGRFQAAVEILVEMVDQQAKGIVHNAKSRKFVAPLALTIFVWIFLLNAMDLLPGRPVARPSGPRSSASPATIRTTPTCASCRPPTSR